MDGITKNEIKVLLVLLKSYGIDYNANNLSKRVGLSPMGVLKILKRLEEQHILVSKTLGKAVFYKPNYASGFAKKYLAFLLRKEVEDAPPRVKRWAKEVEVLQNHAEIGVLFGSVLSKQQHEDVDLLVVLEQQQNEGLQNALEEVNKVNLKRIHAVIQSKMDLTENITKKNPVVQNAIKTGVVAFGQEELVEVIGDVAR